jgi:sRNA-binding protein
MYRVSREESEDLIRKLAEAYPKCFFEIPQQRRPLKKNILADLEREGFPAASELLSAGIEWYMSHFGYQHALTAGAKRINLDGKEVGTVTELEERAAKKKITEGKQRNAIRIMSSMHSAGLIADDQLRKVDAPPMRTKSSSQPPDDNTWPTELVRVQNALSAAATAWQGSGDVSLRGAMAAGALSIVIKEAQRAITSFTGEPSCQPGDDGG